MRKIFTLIIFSSVASLALSQAPTATFEVSDNAVCAGECITIENTSTNTATSWVWNFGTGATPSSYSGPEPGPVCFPVAGTYNITLTASNTFGTVSTSQSVTVTPLPVVNATLSDTLDGEFVEIIPDTGMDFPDTTIYMFQEAYLWAEGLPAGGTMAWFPSGVADDSIIVNNGDSLTVTPFYDTYYVVSYSINGCTAYDTVFVNVLFEDTLFIVTLPNSFSPNGDGENDSFKLLTNVDEENNFANGFKEGGAIAEVDFRIFDRYGHMVFRTTDPHEGWDGTCNGKPVNPATYTYILNYRRIDNRSGELKGNVTLFR